MFFKNLSIGRVNPFTLRVPFECIVCYSHTFENNLVIQQKFAKYLNKSCCVASDKHFSIKCFPKNIYVNRIFPKSPARFDHSGCKWDKTPQLTASCLSPFEKMEKTGVPGETHRITPITGNFITHPVSGLSIQFMDRKLR